MSTKTENVKNFINQIGKDNQLFLFVGSNDTETISDAPAGELDAWRYSDFSVKIGKDNLIPVVPNVKWTRKRTYAPWKSNLANYGNYYAYNEVNGYVYLCISDNRENRTDYEGKNVSNNIPSHVSGDYTYDDGYTWKALYKITPNIEKFVTEQWIPVVSFDLYENLDKTSIYSQMQSFCSPSGVKTSGNCAIYFKENTQYVSWLGTVSNAEKGSLFDYYTTECHECFNTFKDNPKFIAKFTTTTPASSIVINDTYDLIGELINQKKISVASPYYYLYQVNKDSPDEGYIVSVKIDLTGVDQEDLSISVQNPEITVKSNSGQGASIRLKTYVSAINNKIYVNGIEIISKGSGYRDVFLELASASMLGSLTAEQLMAKITVNLDEMDGLGFDPMKVLESKHTMIDVRIDKPTLNTSNLSIPSHINFYSLVQNPKYDSTFGSVAGSTENKYLSTLYRTTIKLSVTTPTSVGGVPILPIVDDPGTITIDTGKELNNVIVSTIIPPASPGGDSKFEIKGLEYSDASSLINANFVVNGVNYTVNAVDASPSLVQYTGKILSSNKTTNLPIQETDTALIRINMVKGM